MGYRHIQYKYCIKKQQEITFLRFESLQARQNFGPHLAGKMVLASLHNKVCIWDAQ